MKWLLLAIPLVLFSCKKKDEVSPDVNIAQQQQLSTSYQLPTTLFLQIKASDNKGLKSLSVEIRNLNNITVAGPRGISLNGEKEYTWSPSLEIDNRYIPSGNYYLAATARDESNSSSDFYEFFLVEVPLESQRIDVLTTAVNSSRVDTGYYGGALTEAIFTDRIDFMAFDPHEQTIFTSGSPESGIKIYNTNWSLINQTQTLTGGEGAYFYKVLPQSIDGRFFAATFDHALKAFDHLGNIKKTYTGPPSTRGRAVGVSDDHVIGGFASFDQEQWFISSFFRQSGAMINTTSCPFEVQAISPDSDNTFILQGEQDGAMVWARYYVIENAIENISSSPITSLGTSFHKDNGAIASFDNALQYSNNLQSFFSLEPAFENEVIAWDKSQGLLLFNNSSELKVNDGTFPFMNQNVQTWQISGSPKQALILYNK